MRHRANFGQLRRMGAGRAPAAVATLVAPAPDPATGLDPVEAERQRILRWLHDGPLQALEYIAADGWRPRGGADPDELARVAADAADALRRFIREGGEPEITVALVDAVRQVVDEARRHGPQRIELVRGPADGALYGPPLQALAGSLREALTNARKHSGAERVFVYCEEEDGRAVVTVRDDGVGGASGDLAGGFGIRSSIMERMAAAGGWARVERAATGGVVVMLGIDRARPR